MKRIDIFDVELSNRYKIISKRLGYNPDEYLEDVLNLISIWKSQKYVEIYENDLERSYGRLKDSNSTPGSTPWYIDLYHARAVRDENDPLVVLEFKTKEDGGLPVLIVKFLIHHEEMFGTLKQKKNRQEMQALRRRIDAYRKEDNN